MDTRRHLSVASTRLTLAVILAALTPACSIESYVVNKLGDALAADSTTFASDDDPELVKAAVPFSLKLMESLLEKSPRHAGLLQATCKGFTQYAYAFVQQESDALEYEDLSASRKVRDRARKLYLRARDYGLRGLDVAHSGVTQDLHTDPVKALGVTGEDDVPLLYWTAAAWAAAVSVSKDDPDRIGELHIVEALIDRALELDEGFDGGAIHSFLISYDSSRPGSPEEQLARSTFHFERAMELSGGHSAGPLVAYAEAVALERQDAGAFRSLLERALAIDLDAAPERRLANLIMQE
jgi:predicted anti-sigma-YlaC factor YlaD